MSKLDKIGYYDKTTGETIEKDVVDAIRKEDRNNKISKLKAKFKNKTIEYIELLELMSMIKKPTNVKILYESFYKVNMHKSKPDGITDSEYGKFFNLLNYISYKNTLEHTNGKVLKMQTLAERLGFKTIKSLKNYIRKLTKYKMLAEITLGGIDYLLINPAYMIHPDFILTKSTYLAFKQDMLDQPLLILNGVKTQEVFDYIKDDIKQVLSSLDYTQLEFKFNPDSNYKVYNEPINCNGVYLLYKNDTIIYVGKSKNMKNRIREHKNDKDFDSVKCIQFKDEGLINLYEPYLIQKYRPKYNKDLLDKIDLKLPEINLKGEIIWVNMK